MYKILNPSQTGILPLYPVLREDKRVATTNQSISDKQSKFHIHVGLSVNQILALAEIWLEVERAI